MKIVQNLLLLFFALISGVAMAQEQIITPDPVSQSAGPGASVSFDAVYSTANPVDDTLTGLGLTIYWDSNRLTFVNLTNILSLGQQPVGSPTPDAANADGDANTDTMLLVAWIDIGGNWPGTTPQSLYTANFTTANTFADSTTVNFTGQTAAGRTFQSTSASIAAAASVPDVVGLSQTAATTAITGAGLAVGTVSNQASATVPAGNVISQSPAAGTSVATGSSVDLVVSSGPAPVTVPDVVGQSQTAAEAAIAGAGLAVGTVTTQESATVPAGNVISQNPAAGTSVAAGSSVDLVVSAGPAPVTVPDVVGQSQAAAEAAITGAGLVVGNVTRQTSATVPVGDVISQNPAAGASVAAGSSVDLVVSGSPLAPALPAPIPTMSAWGLIMLATLLAVLGVRRTGRRIM